MSLGSLASASAATAACRLQLLPDTGLAFRQTLQTHLRDLGITGFGRTQPYGDSTISLFLSSDVSLVLRLQDQLVIEIGEEVPLPAEPMELAKFNALSAYAAARFSGEDEHALRAKLLASINQHGTVGSWIERSGDMVLVYARAYDALVVKMHKEKCDQSG